MNTVHTVVRKVLSRGLLIGICVVSAVGVLAALLYGALTQASMGLNSTVELSVAVPPDEVPDLPLPQVAAAQYSTVTIHLPADDNPALSLQQAAALLPFLVGALTCALVFALAVRLFRRRPFGLAVGVSMLTLAALAIGSGFAVPALEARAETVLVEAFALPTDGVNAPTWVVPGTPAWEYSDWPLIMLGLLTALGGWLVIKGRAMARDLEGTI